MLYAIGIVHVHTGSLTPIVLEVKIWLVQGLSCIMSSKDITLFGDPRPLEILSVR